MNHELSNLTTHISHDNSNRFLIHSFILQLIMSFSTPLRMATPIRRRTIRIQPFAKPTRSVNLNHQLQLIFCFFQPLSQFLNLKIFFGHSSTIFLISGILTYGCAIKSHAISHSSFCPFLAYLDFFRNRTGSDPQPGICTVGNSFHD